MKREVIKEITEGKEKGIKKETKRRKEKVNGKMRIINTRDFV